MTLFTEIQAHLEVDPRVTSQFNPPWFSGSIDRHPFAGLVLENPASAVDRADLEHLERLRLFGFRAWVIRSWRDVQSCLLCEPSNVYLDLS